jgi:phosphoglycerate-specific signal transduction histidine kinase
MSCSPCGEGAASLFKLYASDLAASIRADRAVEQNVVIQRELDHAASALVEETETAMKKGVARLADNLDFTRSILLVIGMASVIAAGWISVFYVRRRLVRRLTSIGNAMQRLSAGDVHLDVPAYRLKRDSSCGARPWKCWGSRSE